MITNYFSWELMLLLIGIFPVSSKSGCNFSGQMYDVGSKWHPHLQSNGAPVCATCECYKDGKFNCTSKECIPETCFNPGQDPESCCATCKEVPQDSSVESTSISGQQFSCLYEGRIYRDGQNFSSNTTGLIPRTTNQCVQCTCKSGAISCELRTCAPLTCPVITRIPSNCCPVCDGLPIDCYSGHRSYSHGSRWHAQLSTHSGCEECECHYGKVECRPLRCPKGKRACAKDALISEKCCPSCFKKRSQKSNVRTGVRSTSRPAASSNPSKTTAKFMCLPVRTQVLLYRNQAEGNTSGYIQFLFVFPGMQPRSELHSWTLKGEKISDFKSQQLSEEHTSMLRKTFNFKLQGATHQKVLQTFSQKERKLKLKCTNRCVKKILRLEKVLKLKKLQTRSQCLKGETSVST